MESVYIGGNVSFNAMTNWESLSATCVSWTPTGHTGFMTVYDYDGRWKEKNADDQMWSWEPDAFLKLDSVSCWR